MRRNSRAYGVPPQTWKQTLTPNRQLTTSEKLYIKYGRALLDWLEPHHVLIKHATMTSGVALLEAARSKSTSTTASGKKGNAGKKTAAAATPVSNGVEAPSDDFSHDITVTAKPVTGMLTLQEPVEVPPIPEELKGKAEKEPSEGIVGFFNGAIRCFKAVPCCLTNRLCRVSKAFRRDGE